jgi:hypothetical protein
MAEELLGGGYWQGGGLFGVAEELEERTVHVLNAWKMGSGSSQKTYSHVFSTQAKSVLIRVLDSSVDSPIFEEIQSIPSYQTLKIGHRGWSLLHLAVWKGNFLLSKQLLEAHFSPVQPDNTGETPLDLARELQDRELIELLTTAEREKHTNSTLDAESRNREQLENYGNISKAVESVQIRPE